MSKPVKHPPCLSAFDTRILGIPFQTNPEILPLLSYHQLVVPWAVIFVQLRPCLAARVSLKTFLKAVKSSIDVMADLEEKLKVSSFFILDENFLLHSKRALSLLEQMKKNNKSWALYVFSSARVLRSYTIEQLVELGISWVWMGLEGEQSQYAKLTGIETRALVADLQEHGIRVLGSSIIGLEEHTPENIDEVIDYAVSHSVDFHQFMLYTANHGTPLHAQLKEKGALLPGRDLKSLTAMASIVSITAIRIFQQVRRNNYCSMPLNRTLKPMAPAFSA